MRQRAHRRLAPLAAAAMAVTALAITGQASAQGGLRAAIVPGTQPIQVWGLQSENVNSNYTPVPPDQALIDAAHFTFITAHPVAYQGQVAAMKAINPRLQILAYENGVFSQPSQGPTSGYCISYGCTYLKDARGAYVTNPSSGNFLMDPTNAGWIQNRIDTCRQLMAQSGYDGCYLDMLGLASLSGGFVSGRPIDPRTGLAWAPNDWIANTAGVAASITSAVAPSLVVGNGIKDGTLYYSPTTPTKPILDAVDAGIAEAWLRGSKIPITSYQEGVVWVRDVALMGAAESAGKALFALVKIGVPATPAQINAWQQYGLATFLMGTQGRSAYFFSPSAKASRTSWYPMYDLVLGQPSGSMRQLKGNPGRVYQRPFQYGLVVVNNNAIAATVTLPGGPYYDISGNLVPTTAPITVGPNTGMVLRTRLTPITTVNSGPVTPTVDTNASIAFSADTVGSTFTCALDGAAPQPCTSPVQYSGLSEGAHLVSIQATDPLGVVGTAVPYSWAIDLSTPTASINSGPADGSGSSATFSFSSSKPASTFTCSLDAAPPVACTTPTAIAGVTTGAAHTYTVAVTDPYGIQGTPVTWSWTA